MTRIDTHPLLAVDALSVASADGQLLAPVSFTLEAGRALTLLGESGSGKSLLAHALMGTLPRGLRAGGTLTVDGRRCDAADPATRRAMWGRQLALLPQEPWFALDPTMRVGRQLAETHALAGLGNAQAWRRALHDLHGLGMAHAAQAWPTTLSGGMAQRVAFAITRAGGAPVLIVDEPTKGLDRVWRDELVARLQVALGEGCALLTITHDIAVARALGGDVAVMLDGRLVERGDAAAVLGAPGHAYTRALVAAEPANWPAVRAPSPGGDEILRACGVSKQFGDRSLFRSLDVTLHAGERLAVTGPSGSGKSTLGNVLLGLVAPDAGTVHRPDRIEKVRYQKLYQDPAGAFAPHASIGRALEDLAALHRIDRTRIAPLLKRLKLAPHLLARRPGAVSGGELQRFALLRALLLTPAFLFADEPTSRLDPVTQQDTLALTLEACAETGAALMLVTHDEEIAARVSDRRMAIGYDTPFPQCTRPCQ